MLMLGAKRAALASPAIWTPRRNWPDASSLGFWLDPTSFANIYQDSAGTSPVTAVEQPAGLALDKRLGLSQGVDAAINGNFSLDTGWTKASGWTISGGSAVFSGGNDKQLTQASLTAGKWYAYEVTATIPVAGKFTVWDGASSAIGWCESVGTKTYTGVIRAGTTTLAIYASSGSFSIDNISVRELPGNHFSQATSTSRPIVRVTGGVQSLALDGLDDGLSTGPITLGANMDVLLAIRINEPAVDDAIMSVSGGGSYLLALGGTGPIQSGCGAPTYAVNGVLKESTRASVGAAMPVGSWVVVEVRNANLSAWPTFSLSGWTQYTLAQSIAGCFACPAGSEAIRAKNRKWLGEKVGLSLP